MNKELFESLNPTVIYGEFYGRHKNNEHAEYVEIEIFKLKQYDDGLLYVWGWPGPDMNFYSWEEYGDTWALTKKELGDVKFYETETEMMYQITLNKEGKIIGREYKIQDKNRFYLPQIVHKDKTITVTRPIADSNENEILEQARVELNRAIKMGLL